MSKNSFEPYVSPSTHIPEFTFRAVILGLFLGLIFGLGNAYLGLRVGTTVSASIPAAVLSIACMRLFKRKGTILESNMVQTIASVGEGIAAGTVFTIPALYLLPGVINPENTSFLRVFMLSSLGGILGVLFMIPMRRYIIVEQHEKLKFPEGTACAEILKSAETAGQSASLTLFGILSGALYKVFSNILFLWKEVPTWNNIKWLQGSSFSMDCTPALFGVGTIVGPRISALIFSGGALSFWVLIPLIRIGMHATIPTNTEIPSAEDIWSGYVRYIGCGAVAIGGMLSLVKVFPIIGKTVDSGIKELFQNQKKGSFLPRTERDISLRYLLLGSIAIVLTLWLFPHMPMNFLTILLLVGIGFFFVAVTSLTVGIVGSTSNPVSGMTITTVLLTCLIFVSLGWVERGYLIGALTMGCVANVAVSLAGTTSQDLKTGYLLGATPRYQQLGEILGILLPSLCMGGVIMLLNKIYVIGSPQMPAPQGSMLAMIAEGVISGNLQTPLVLIGVIIGLIVQMMGLPVLPFAIGLYLPLSLTTPMMLGGIVGLLLTHLSKKSKENTEIITERTSLFSAGLIAGDACMGIIIALLVGGVSETLFSQDKTTFFKDGASLAIFIFFSLCSAYYISRVAKKASL